MRSVHAKVPQFLRQVDGWEKKMMGNRVTPDGALVAAPPGARGLLMGNRGTLRPSHYDKAQPAAPGANWITCVIRDEGGNLLPKVPVKYTKLFFLDEVTAFAAGHRPCGQCQKKRYWAFVKAWAAANEMLPEQMDETIRAECVSEEGGCKPSVVSCLDALPSGTMVRLAKDGVPHLWYSGQLIPWSVTGYGARVSVQTSTEVEVLTPMSIVRVLQAGFPLDPETGVHPTALAPEAQPAL